jgi:hypothetical protein
MSLTRRTNPQPSTARARFSSLVTAVDAVAVARPLAKARATEVAEALRAGPCRPPICL